MKKITRILLIVMTLVILLPAVVSAAPYTTYTYTSDGTILVSPDAYVPDTIIDSKKIGLDVPFDDPRDLFVDQDGKVYVADAVNARIIVLDRYYNLDFTIEGFVNEHGVPDSFSGPSGVFVTNGKIYVCDTDNNRIVLFDDEGNYIKIIDKPESGIFGEGSIYKPIACAADAFGRLYVISSTTYQGVIVMNEESEFYGFIGAQKATLSPLEALMRSFQTAEQRARSGEVTSTEFNNITIDADGFIYVTTSSIDETQQQAEITAKSKSADYAPVKKLNSSGADVMRRNGLYPPSGEVKMPESLTAEIKGASTIVDVAMGPEGTWSIVDQKRSKVFTYDENGNLLHAFGDIGNQIGNVTSISSIAYQGDKILLLDKTNDNIVVYRRTEYGDLLMRALENDNNRKYDEAINDWTEILKRNNNYEVAYTQIGKALYRNAEYEESIRYYEAIKETENYSASFKEIRKEWAGKYFWILPIVIVAAFVGLAKLFGYAKQVNKRAALKIGRKSLREEILYAFHLIFHPFDGFWDLKHERRGSVKSAFVILLVTVLSFFYQSIGSGYIMNQGKTSYMSVLGTIAAVILPLALWAIANWCLTTLFEGEGSMKDIFIACCYSLTPLPLFIIPSTIASNFILAEEAEIISMLSTIAFVWMGLLLFFGMMVTHDYPIMKNILTCAGTILGMMFLMFLGLLFSTLMSQIVKFVTDIAVEIGYRL